MEVSQDEKLYPDIDFNFSKHFWEGCKPAVILDKPLLFLSSYVFTA
jgi:hypothetical protein